MKKISLALSFLGIVAAASAQTPFTPSALDGFGWINYPINYNNAVMDMKSFKGNLYVGMGNSQARVYRSSTGDGGTFQNVFQDQNCFKVDNMTTTNDAGGNLFMAAWGNSIDMWVMRTSNGSVWDTVYHSNTGQNNIFSITAFKGLGSVDSIYVAHQTPSGATVVERSSVTSNDPDNFSGSWQGIFNSYMEFGTNAHVTASAVFNGKLCYTLSDNYMYTTADGRSLAPDAAFTTGMGAGSGLGNSWVTSMEVYNSELYLGTYNTQSGYEIWKTPDGINYTSLRDSLYDGKVRVQRMKAVNGKLWIMVSDMNGMNNGHFEILSYDGTSFTSENSNNFGVSHVNADIGNALEGFNNHLYAGISNTFMPSRLADPGLGHDGTMASQSSTGGQVWRACLVGANPTVTLTPNPVFTCPGGSVTITAATNGTSAQWQDGVTSLTHMRSDTGIFYFTAIAANGCRVSDTSVVHNYPHAPAPVFTSGSNPNTQTEFDFCLGDSALITVHDPAVPANALYVPGQDMGFAAPSTNVFNTNRDITIEMWFKSDNLYVDATIISEDDALATPVWSHNMYPLIRIDYNGYVYVNIPGSTTSAVNIGQIYSWQWTNWHHVALRYNSATSTLDGFLDGVQGASDTRTRSVPQDDGGLDRYKVGFQGYAPDLSSNVTNLTGYVKDIRIWNSARTNTEIINNMNGLPAATYPSLTYYYKADETSGTVIHDASTNGYDATLNGSNFLFTSVSAFSWIPDPTLSVQSSNSAFVYPTALHTYKAVYTDGNGCTSDTGFVNAGPFFLDIYPSLAASCGGNAASLSYNTNASMITTTWTSATLGSVPTNSVNVTPASPEWVYVSAPLNGCVLQDSVLVNVGPSFQASVNPGPSYGCQGTDVILDGNASGGTAPYHYKWTAGNGDTTITATDSLVYTMLSYGDEVQLRATDAIGCEFMEYFDTYPTSSTDLFGHVTTPPPTVSNVTLGSVYVFKHQPGSAGLDTLGYAPLDANGNYDFSPLTAGNYLIKVLADETNYPLAVPTYYGNAFQWDSSLVYTHGCTQSDTANIELVVMDGLTGTATISGYIIEGDSFGVARYGWAGHPDIPCIPGGPLKGIDVKLGKNPGSGIQARVSSDSTGFYEFQHIPDGGYRIYVDIPNLPMDSTREIIVAAGDSSIQNNYFADSASIYINPDTIWAVGIYASTKVYENKFGIYPNPGRGMMYASYTLTQSDVVTFEIRNAMGQLIKAEPPHKYPEGKNIYMFNTDQLNLQSGVYFISILTGNKKYTQRLVVIE